MDVKTLREIAKKEGLKVTFKKFDGYCMIFDIKDKKTLKSIIEIKKFSPLDNKEYICVKEGYQRKKTPRYFAQEIDY